MQWLPRGIIQVIVFLVLLKKRRSESQSVCPTPRPNTYLFETNRNIFCPSTDFFIALDHENGPITLHSTLNKVVKYVQAGLQKLKQM